MKVERLCLERRCKLPLPTNTHHCNIRLKFTPRNTEPYDTTHKQSNDLNIFPFGELERPPGRPRTMWIKTIQQDLKSDNLSLNEAIHVTQNCPPWRLMSAFGAMYS